MYRFSDRLLKKVTYRENVILLEFSEYMHIQKEENSYLNKLNYLLHIGKRKFTIPEYVNLEIIKKGFIIRMIFPKNYANKLCNINSVYLGYIGKNKIFYIESFNGLIQNILTPICLEKEVEILNIEDGRLEILDDNTLKYIYKGKNEFYNVEVNDFYVKKLNEKYFPKDFYKTGNEFIFNFEENIFYDFNDDISFNVVNEPKSNDIYGLAIKKSINLKIIDKRATYVKSLSLSDYKEEIAYFKIYFSATLNNFSDKDFLIQRNDALYRCFYEYSNKERNLINVKVYNIKTENILKDKFKLVLLKGVNNKIRTIDYKNEEIILKKESISNVFISNNIEWEKTNYELKGSILKISFQKMINPSSMITNSNFDEKINPWNGKDIQIPIMGVEIKNEKNFSTIMFKNNKNFGSILINYNKDLTYIDKTIYNQSPCNLYLNSNELFIKFDEAEETDINFLNLKSMIYNPTENIKDLDGNFIFCGYCPIKHLGPGEVIYVEPLKSEKENPFNGKIKNNSFVIKVDNENKFRIYGNYENQTVITGFLKIIGELSSNQSVVIQNIKVLGNIYVHIGDSNIVFDRIECDSLICEELNKA